MDSSLNDILLRAFQVKESLTSKIDVEQQSNLAKIELEANVPKAILRRNDQKRKISLELMMKLFHKKIIFSIENYLEYHEKNHLQIFMKSIRESYNQRLLLQKAYSNSNSPMVTPSTTSTTLASSKSSHIKRIQDEYQYENKKFIMNLIEIRKLNKSKLLIQNQVINELLWQHEHLYGEKLRRQFWMEKLDLSHKITTYRLSGNIQSYHYQCRILQERYEAYFRDAIDILKQLKEQYVTEFNEIKVKTIQILQDMYSYIPSTTGSSEDIDLTQCSSELFPKQDQSYVTIQSKYYNIRALITKEIHQLHLRYTEFLTSYPTTIFTNDSNECEIRPEMEVKLDSLKNACKENCDSFQEIALKAIDNAFAMVMKHHESKSMIMKSILPDTKQYVIKQRTVQTDVPQQEESGEKKKSPVRNRANSEMIV